MSSNITIPNIFAIIQTVTQGIAATPGLKDLDTDPSSPTGQLINTLSNDYLQLYLLLNAIYGASKANMAQGQALRDLLSLINIYDPGGTQTVVPNVVLTGLNGTVIPAGSLVATSSGNQFYSANTVTISGVTATVNFYAVNNGAIAVAAGTLTTIVTPIAGWSAVGNTEAGVTGTNALTDFELRQQQQNLINQYSMGYIGAIKSRIYQNSTVIDINLIENDTDTTFIPPTNVPPTTFLAIIYYIDQTQEQAIANSYFLAKGAPAVFANIDGTEVTETVTDVSGNPHTIVWNQATPVPLYIIVNATTTSEVSGDAVDLVTQALVEYVSGGGGEDGMTSQNDPGIATIGGTLVYTRLLASVADLVPNFNIETFFVGTAPTPTGVVDLSAAFNEIFTLISTNIIINIS